MLDFVRPSPFDSNISLTDVLMAHDEDKYSTGQLYVRQPYSLQIIQLVEEPAPPPRKQGLQEDSSMDSDSASSYWSSDYSESASEEEDEEEEEECSSYCSSLEEESELPETERVASSTDTLSLRLKRILAWREDFYAHADACLSESSLPSLKRKLETDEDSDDNLSHSSKRSRSQASSVSSLGMHSCPACDAFFDTQQSLRQHGLDAKANNDSACSAAVEYEFE